MKKAILKEAAKSFATEKLLPGLGKAYAVFVLAKILASEAQKSADPNSILDQMIKIIENAGDTRHVYALYGTGALFIIVLCIKLYSAFKRPPRWLFKIASRHGHWLSTALRAAAGTLIVPLTIWLAVTLELPDSSLYAYYWTFGKFVIVYLACSFGFHYLTLEDRNNVAGAAVFLLQEKENEKGAEAADACATLNKHFESSVAWVGEAVVLADTDDGHVVVALPIRYPMRKWKQEDCDTFMQKYDTRKSALKDTKFNLIGGSLSPELKEIIKSNKEKPRRRKLFKFKRFKRS